MASAQFNIYYALAATATPGQYTINGRSLTTVNIFDYSDSAGDDLNVFGDISDDNLGTSANARNLTWVGNSSVSGDIILRNYNTTTTFLVANNRSNPYANGTLVTNAGGTYTIPVCYVSGSRILTTGGEVAVEDLRVGDLAVTAAGEARPIRWIGHRTLACRGRADLLPVRIAAHAFGAGRPARDLRVSPAHAIAVDVLGEVLIPACRLINGTTITQDDVASVTYWHVELDSHDILLAEGLPAESYLECGNRHFFADAAAIGLFALPGFRPAGPLPFCRPFHEDGALVDAVRARLQDRAATLGWTRVEETFAGLHLIADGRVIRPDTEGRAARFVLPADARDVHLVSETSVPAHVLPGSTDERRLGVAVHALAIDDGLSAPRRIALDDPRLTGFHALGAETTWRWTDGDATLPATLWAGCRGTVFLRVDLAAAALPRWVAPAAGTASSRRQA